jgi:hypothetical protein
VLNSAQNIIKLGAKSDKRIPNDEQV